MPPCREHPSYRAILSKRMNISRSLKLLTVFLALFAFAFSLVCSWKLSLSMSSMREAQGSCLQAGSQAGCPLLSDQSMLVQDVFSAALPETSLLLMAFFLLAALALLSTKNTRAADAFSDSFLGGIPHRHFRNPAIFLFNHLRLAFAQGILNPKIPHLLPR